MTNTDTVTADDISNAAASQKLAAAILESVEAKMLPWLTARGPDEMASAVAAAAFVIAIGRITVVRDQEFAALVVELLINGAAGEAHANDDLWPKLHS